MFCSLFLPNAKLHDFTAMVATTNDTVFSNVGDIMPQVVYWTKEGQDFPLVIDTGASTSLAPLKEDFVEYHKVTNQQVSGIAGAAKVLGRGKVEWTIFDDNGKPHKIRTEAYHAPDA
ncbi:hypothetical protein ACA910_007008 [Epithemia clementina (nom. ined.)]